MELCGKANAIDLPLRMGFSFHKNGDDLGMVAMALVHAPGSISLDGVPGPDLSGGWSSIDFHRELAGWMTIGPYAIYPGPWHT